MFKDYMYPKELNFKNSIISGYSKFLILPNFDKLMTIFWLLGPFIYLIERSPADMWLSLIGIIFLIRCFRRKTKGRALSAKP